MAWDPAPKQSPRDCAGCHDAVPKAEQASRLVARVRSQGREKSGTASQFTSGTCFVCWVMMESELVAVPIFRSCMIVPLAASPSRNLNGGADECHYI